MARRKRWLQVRAFVTCERVEGGDSSHTTGPWTLHGVWHDFQLSAPFADLPGAAPFAPLALFVQLVSRLNHLSQPRELEAHLYQREEPHLVCRYRFPPRSFRPGTMVYITLPLQPPPITIAGWYTFLLVLDNTERIVLARSEVYLTP